MKFAVVDRLDDLPICCAEDGHFFCSIWKELISLVVGIVKVVAEPLS
jgi:hypothetical protein